MTEIKAKVIKIADQYILNFVQTSWQTTNMVVVGSSGKEYIYPIERGTQAVGFSEEPISINLESSETISTGWKYQDLEITNEEWNQLEEDLLKGIEWDYNREEWDFKGDLDAEFEFKKFRQKWSRTTEQKKTLVPIEFITLNLNAKPEDKDIRPIASIGSANFGLYAFTTPYILIENKIKELLEESGFTAEWDNNNDWRRAKWEASNGLISLNVEFRHKAFGNHKELWTFGSGHVGTLESCVEYKAKQLEKVEETVSTFLSKFDSVDGVTKKQIIALLESAKNKFSYFTPPHSHTNKRSYHNQSRNNIQAAIDLLK